MSYRATVLYRAIVLYRVTVLYRAIILYHATYYTVLPYYTVQPIIPCYRIIPCMQAHEALALGELQLAEGFRSDAVLNFHTACVYYRVMECTIPALMSQVHQWLQYAAWRARQCSRLTHNFIGENFINGKYRAVIVA